MVEDSQIVEECPIKIEENKEIRKVKKSEDVKNSKTFEFSAGSATYISTSNTQFN
jgi:hypothetical protein